MCKCWHWENGWDLAFGMYSILFWLFFKLCLLWEKHKHATFSPFFPPLVWMNRKCGNWSLNPLQLSRYSLRLPSLLRLLAVWWEQESYSSVWKQPTKEYLRAKNKSIQIKMMITFKGIFTNASSLSSLLCAKNKIFSYFRKNSLTSRSSVSLRKPLLGNGNTSRAPRQ